MPDARTLLKLSRVLECSFEEETRDAPQADAAPDRAEALHCEVPSGEAADAQPPEEPVCEAAADTQPPEVPAGEPEAAKPAARGHKAAPAVRRWIIAVVALAVALCACVMLLLRHRASAPTVFSAEDGTTYTIEQFQREAPREAGKAYLTLDKVLTVTSDNGMEMWLYDFVFHELNGVGMAIDSVEICHFTTGGVRPYAFSGNGSRKTASAARSHRTANGTSTAVCRSRTR